jgi:hypothetical protein
MGVGETNLTQDMLAPVVQQAYTLWANQGWDREVLATLAKIDIEIADLGGDLLAQTMQGSNRIMLDRDAGGLGWSVDLANAPKAGTFDLLSVVTHEIGHQLGFDVTSNYQDVMGAYLNTGVRRVDIIDERPPQMLAASDVAPVIALGAPASMPPAVVAAGLSQAAMMPLAGAGLIGLESVHFDSAWGAALSETKAESISYNWVDWDLLGDTSEQSTSEDNDFVSLGDGLADVDANLDSEESASVSSDESAYAEALTATLAGISMEESQGDESAEGGAIESGASESGHSEG